MNEIKQAKLDYYTHLIGKINDSVSCGKKWWKLVKSLNGGNGKPLIPDLLINNELIHDLKRKCDILNEYFTSQSTVDDSVADLPEINMDCPEFEMPEIDPDTVYKTLMSLNLSKATGPDLISNQILNRIAPGISASLSRLFNYSLSVGSFPNQWKVANVIPIYKKGDKSKVESYRPVSLLCGISKVFERIVANSIKDHLESNNLISEKQSGFKKGDSTVNQLIYFYEIVSSAFENGEEVRAIYLDISKAFDKIWHRGLLHKLRAFGFKNEMLAWFKSYLTDRGQKVVLNGITSSVSYLNAGVPQGSILGPILFTMYVNDVTSEVLCDILLYADDMTLIHCFIDKNLSDELLNRDLKAIEDWAKKWLITFNPIKTEAMTYSSRRVPSSTRNLRFMNTGLQEVQDHKHLGLRLNVKLHWAGHIDDIVLKCKKRLSSLSQFKYKLSRGSLNTLYFAMVRSLLDYGCVLFYDTESVHTVKLENIQYQAGIIVSGAMKTTSYNKILSELGWPRLSERTKFLRACLFYKGTKGLTVKYFHDLIADRCSRAGERRQLRTDTQFIPPFSRSERYINSFIPASCRIWNSIPDSVKNVNSIESFRYHYKKTFFSQQLPGYSSGNRRPNVLHTRFRLGFTQLNSDLFIRSLTDSPNCRCGYQNESYSHYFLDCPLHIVSRNSLFTSINQKFPYLLNSSSPAQLLNLFIFGFDDLMHSKYNVDLFELVQTFIVSSKRFKCFQNI